MTVVTKARSSAHELDKRAGQVLCFESKYLLAVRGLACSGYNSHWPNAPTKHVKVHPCLVFAVQRCSSTTYAHQQTEAISRLVKPTSTSKCIPVWWLQCKDACRIYINNLRTTADRSHKPFGQTILPFGLRCAHQAGYQCRAPRQRVTVLCIQTE